MTHLIFSHKGQTSVAHRALSGQHEGMANGDTERGSPHEQGQRVKRFTQRLAALRCGGDEHCRFSWGGGRPDLSDVEKLENLAVQSVLPMEHAGW